MNHQPALADDIPLISAEDSLLMGQQRMSTGQKEGVKADAPELTKIVRSNSEA